MSEEKIDKADIIVLQKDVDQIKKEQGEQSTRMKDIEEALWKKDGEDMGLIPRVKRNTEILEGIQSDVKRLVWIIVGSVATFGLAIIYQIIITHPLTH